MAVGDKIGVAVCGDIAPILTATQADRRYFTGELIYLNGKICYVITDVSQGVTWAENSNYRVADLTNLISAVEGRAHIETDQVVDMLAEHLENDTPGTSGTSSRAYNAGDYFIVYRYSADASADYPRKRYTYELRRATQAIPSGDYDYLNKSEVVTVINEIVALRERTDKLYDSVQTGPATGSLEFNNLPNEPFSLNADLMPRQSGEGTPSTTNIRPFIDRQAVTIAVNGTDQTISIKRTGGSSVPFIAAARVTIGNGNISVKVCPYYAAITSAEASLLRGQWACDRAVYSAGRTPPIGSQVVDLYPLTLNNYFSSQYMQNTTGVFVSKPQNGTTTTIESTGDKLTVISRSDIQSALLMSRIADDRSDAADTQTRKDIAPLFKATENYAVGDYCIYDGTLYRCTTAITTPEDWTAAHWTAVSLGGDIVSYLPMLFPLIAGIPLTSYADLNDCTGFGCYTVTSNDANTISNKPSGLTGSVAFRVFVLPLFTTQGATRAVQVCLQSNSTSLKIWIRWNNAGTWYNWQVLHNLTGTTS